MKKTQNDTTMQLDILNKDFKSLNLPTRIYTYKYDSFLKVPNFLIKTDIQKTLNESRILLIVYLFIYRRRTYEDVAYLTIRQILDFCGYRATRHRPKIFYEIIRCFLFLKENYMITVDFNPLDVSYDQMLEVMIIEENFIPRNDFTRLYIADFDSVMNLKCSPSKEKVLSIYLYICSFIGNYTHNMYNSEFQNVSNPNAFWKSITTISKDLSLSKNTVTQCLDVLTFKCGNEKPLLIKKEMKNMQTDLSIPLQQKAPNIYVLNKYGYQKEIELAINKIKCAQQID